LNLIHNYDHAFVQLLEDMSGESCVLIQDFYSNLY